MRALRRIPLFVLASAVAVALLGSSGGAAAASRSGGRSGPGGQYIPGVVLVRFADRTTADQRAADARRTGTTIERELPLVPELFAVDLRAGETVPQAEAALGKQPRVLYTQPDLIDHDTPDALPNDPYFKPRKYANPGGCSNSGALAQWALWPRGENLAPKTAAFAQYWSINVVPVWDALLAAHRPVGKTGAGANGPAWSDADIRRSGVGIYDTGLSDNPDIANQVAALFSTVTLDRDPDIPGSAKAFVTEVHRDDPSRPDMLEVRRVVNGRVPNNGGHGEHKVQVNDANRPLFALDDVNSLQADSPDVGDLPNGCDGHGTGVSSVAAATTNNGTGLAGVGYNVPIVGVRPGMPWDLAGTALANDNQLPAALASWRRTWQRAETTSENEVDNLATFAAMGVPVVNASLGGKMFVSGDRGVPVLRDPAAAEAYLRLFTSGDTLGVVASGNSAENYGSGPNAIGAHLLLDVNGKSAVDTPCGLPLLRNRRVDVQEGPNSEPWHADVDWNKLLLLCVGNTTSNQSQLASDSGFGSSVVQLGAPGDDITAATRPRALPSGGVDVNSYFNTGGTSLSSPMVAGAAALLREAAPSAPMRLITLALEQGAQPVQSLLNKVNYGQLDVACSLEWLARQEQRQHANWGLIDTLGSPEFTTATAGCARKLAYRVQTTINVSTSELYGETHKFATMSALLASKKLDESEESSSLTWQRTLLFSLGITRQIAGRAIFRLGKSQAEAPGGGGTVYDVGNLSLACGRQNFELSGLGVKFLNAIRPIGWFYPTDAQPPYKGIQVGVVAEKPWFSGLISSLKVQLRGTCSYIG